MARKWISMGGLTLALALAVPVLAEDKTPQEKPAAEKTADQKPAADPYAVPEGRSKELKEFIQKIIRTMPKDEETRKKARAAMLNAAEKMIAANPGEEELDFAVDVKMRSLGASKDIAAFSEALKKEGRTKQARMVRSYSLQAGMSEAILNGKTDAQKKQIAEVLDFLKETPPQLADLSLAIMTGQIAELQEDNAFALETYRNLSKIFSTSKEQQLTEFSKRLEGVVRRLSLLGNKMKLEGKLFSGEPFDFSKYQGKVVLIDFWATWRGACVEELPKLKQIYERYRDKDFEIIGFSCDYRREEVEKFVKDNDMPWINVYGDKGPSSTVEYYGILTIPTMILLGKDGNVKELNVGIEDLSKKLEKLLGAAEEKKD